MIVRPIHWQSYPQATDCDRDRRDQPVTVKTLRAAAAPSRRPARPGAVTGTVPYKATTGPGEPAAALIGA